MLKTAVELQKMEDKLLAPYAMKNSRSAGRIYQEKKDKTRLPFQRDRDRIIHCKAFRRLQAKTQVFISSYGDHYRDRLTHTIEVAQISRDIARTLGLNEDLAEAIALAHDLGHPPFGHSGEAALNEIMQEFGLHFEHNEQSRRIIEKLEQVYPGFDGLNLTKEVLDGLIKHEKSHNLASLAFVTSAHLESQVADLADEIAYTNHDIDDGMRSGLLTIKQMRQFELWRRAEKEIIKKYGKNISLDRLKSRIISRMVAILIHDVCAATHQNIKKLKINNVDDVRKYKGKIVVFKPKTRRELKKLRAFLMKNFYENPKVASVMQYGKSLLKNLFSYYFKHPQELPPFFLQNMRNGERKEIVIKDYIAGMTDRYAEECWKKIKSYCKTHDLSKM